MADPTPSFRFGDFKWICNHASLTICPALGLGDPQCYSRNIGSKSFLLFQPSVLAVDLVAIVMTLIMIFHIKSKYTAVGRKEMVIFFYVYLAVATLEMLLVTNIIPMTVGAYKFFAAAHVGAITAAFSTLLLNGFVGFQWVEDGTLLSVWIFRICAMVFGGAGYFVAISTFLGFAGMSPKSTLALYIVAFVFNAAALLIYVLLQIFLVLNTLTDMWPLGDIFLGLLFFGLSIATGVVFSNEICRLAAHYLDGLFLGSTFSLLAVMMVYKYWDSITKEDLEFSVGETQQVWHLQNTMELPLKSSANSSGAIGGTESAIQNSKPTKY